MSKDTAEVEALASTLGKLMVSRVSPDSKSHLTTVPVLRPPKAFMLSQSTAIVKTLCPPLKLRVHIPVFKFHSFAVPSPEALSAREEGQCADIILTSAACESVAAVAVPVLRSHMWSLPEAEPLTALIVGQSTATAQMTGTGSA
eukprot:CAMPEP_0178427594 /NCGR_PEP_ID=MMETSP0689_2-20121128/29827_1 /TAXON_ID=160604 /ORGANISM="Amphidinium massartii, Strain CS-259" /LENGTH=143 /DNA_ID=CAMNT_0020049309 /DNA_START=389 /DNA_END=820 /DNA_ORIENTATION=-